MPNLFVKQWPAFLVYFGIAVSMSIAVNIDFRTGAIALALCVLGAFLLRFYLPDAKVGWLRSRRRRIDLTFLAALGVALLILALVVPHR
jgi:Protein of unknown function (DUF3017)